MKKKVIILYSTAGMGHKKAAIAIFDAFKNMREDIDVENIDVLDYANPVYKFLYLDFYVFMMSKAKWLWAILYYFSNIPFIDFLSRRVRGILDFYGMPGVAKMLIEKKPDAVIATHFFLPSIAGLLKENKNFTAKIYTLVTDYGPHSFWLSDSIDRFFVGSEFTLSEFVKRGVPKSKIDITGISTTSEFHKEFNVVELKQKYNLDPSKKTIFLMTGGFGVGPMEQMLMELNQCRSNVEVIAVCGHNKVVYENVRKLKDKLKFSLIEFGFTDEVAKLMAVSDLMITKAGGISVTEALNARLPMILFASIPGQETWNEEFLLAAGAVIKIKSVKELSSAVDEMFVLKEEYNSFKTAIDKIRRPYAAEDIVKIVADEITKE
ncbi:MAG: glycosyltransferase [Candidatus Omnitrophota bacterium]